MAEFFMKKEAVIIILMCILSIQFVTADTTFFEGDLGYTGDFLIVPSISSDVPATITGGGGGGTPTTAFTPEEVIVLENELDSQICEICFESIKNQVKEKRTIEYTTEELEALTLEINTLLNSGVSTNYISPFIENFEDRCDRNFPVAIAFAGGRFRDLITPLIGFILIIVSIFLIIIFLVTRKARQIKKGGK